MNKPMHDQSDAINNLCDAILSLKDREECLRFFDDLCTRKELQSIAQRFEVAKLLAEGKKFNEIVQQTGASTATIARVNRSLIYDTKGYRRAGHLPQGRPVVPLRSLHRGAALRKTLQRYGGPPCY